MEHEILGTTIIPNIFIPLYINHRYITLIEDVQHYTYFFSGLFICVNMHVNYKSYSLYGHDVYFVYCHATRSDCKVQQPTITSY